MRTPSSLLWTTTTTVLTQPASTVPCTTTPASTSSAATKTVGGQIVLAQAAEQIQVSPTLLAPTSMPPLTPPLGDLTLQTTTSGNIVLNAAGTTELQDDTNVGGNLTVAASKSLRITGGNTASRPGSPTEGMVYYDTTTKQLLTYANGKWQADRSTATKIVAASNSSQTLKDAADYVATGTGDQATINSALTAAAGGKIYLAEGTYLLSAAISVPNNTTLAGAGSGTVISIPNAQNGSYSMIVNTDTSTGTNVTIRDLKIDGNSSNQTSGSMNGVYMNNMGDLYGTSAVNGSTIDSITVVDVRGRGVYYNSSNNNVLRDSVLGRSFDYTLYVKSSSYNSFLGNRLASPGTLVYDAFSSDNVYANNQINMSGAGGATPFRLSDGSSSTISGNSISSDGSADYELLISDSSSITVAGNQITSLSATITKAIYFTTTSHSSVTGNVTAGTVTGISMDFVSTYNVISSNSLVGVTGGNGLSSSNGSAYNTYSNNHVDGFDYGYVDLSSSGHQTIVDNEFTNVPNYGIYISGYDHNTISGNKIDEPGGSSYNSAIYLTGSDYNKVTDNIVTDTAHSASNDALTITSNANGTYVSNNTLNGGAISDAATDTVYSGQLNDAGTILFQSTGGLQATGSTATALVVQNASSVSALTVDTAANKVQVGSATTDANVILFGIDSYNNGTDPTGFNGASYYNTSLNKFRCYQNGAWTDCIGAGGGGANTSLSNLASTNINTALNTTAGNLTLQTTTSGNIILNAAGTTELQDDTNVGGNLTVAASKSLRITGGNTASRPGSPAEGMVYYDTTTKQLLTYANGKWQADGKDSIIVAANNSTDADKAAADYVADGNTGAAADGDQVQINSALTAADPAGSGRKTGKVVLLAGTYTLDASISVPNNTALTGVGNATLITIPNALNINFSAIVNTDTTTGTGVAIRDLRLDGNKANQSGAIGMAGIDFNNMGGGSGSSARQGAVIERVKADKWYWGNTTNCQAGIGICLRNSSNNKLTSNTATANSSYGISFSSGSYNSVTASSVQGNFTGMLITSSTYNTFTANTVEGNSAAGISLDVNSNNNSVVGNTVQANSAGLSLFTASSNTVTGNTVQTNSTSGISLDTNANNNTVSGNNVHNNGGATGNDGIYISSSDSNSITGNTVTDTSCTSTCFPINITSSPSDNNYLSDNVFSTTSGTATINDAGTGTIFEGQSKTAGGLDILFKQAASATAFQVQNASGSSILTVDTASSVAVFGKAGVLGAQMQLSGATSGSVTISVPSTVTSYNLILPSAAGSANQCLKNSGTPGTLTWGLCGGVGQTNSITISPEYTSATFTPDGTNNTGDLTSDFCSGTSRLNLNTSYCTATQTHNYYMWTTTQATAQDYDIYVRYRMPSDYQTGTLANLAIEGWGTSTATEVVSVSLYSDASGTACSTGSNAVTSNGAWATATAASPLGACTPAAGDMVVFKVHIAAGQNNYALAGGISFDYTRTY